MICLITYSGWYFNNLNSENNPKEDNLASTEVNDKENKNTNKIVNYVKVEDNTITKSTTTLLESNKSSENVVNEDLKIIDQQATTKTKNQKQLEVNISNSEIVKTNKIDKTNIEKNTNEISALANERDPETELVLKSSGNSWVEIEDLDGNSLVTRLMRSGETYVIPKNKGLTLSTGNAGVLSLVYGKIHIKSLGEIGEVISSRPLNIEAFKNRQN